LPAKKCFSRRQLTRYSPRRLRIRVGKKPLPEWPSIAASWRGEARGRARSRDQRGRFEQNNSLDDSIRAVSVRRPLAGEQIARYQTPRAPAANRIAPRHSDDLDITGTAVRNLTKGRDFPIVPLPPARQAIIDAGGLIAYTRRRLIERRD
jgi:hypothetical protein